MENERLDSEEKPHDATAVVGRNKVGRTGGGGGASSVRWIYLIWGGKVD